MQTIQKIWEKIEPHLVWIIPLISISGFGYQCYESLYNHFGDYYIVLLFISGLIIAVLFKMLLEKSDEKK